MFESAEKLGLKVVRMWAFDDGDGWNALQPRIGHLNEHVLRCRRLLPLAHASHCCTIRCEGACEVQAPILPRLARYAARDGVPTHTISMICEGSGWQTLQSIGRLLGITQQQLICEAGTSPVVPAS